MRKIVDGIYTVQRLLVGRVYVIEAADGLTLVDTSLPNSMPRIARQLEQHGHTLSEVKRILITHAHPDHIGSVGALQKATGAQVYAHPKDAPVISGTAPMARPRPEDLDWTGRAMLRVMPSAWVKEPAQVQCEVREGDTLEEILPGLVVIELPGHSPGQIGFCWPGKRLLFGGDVLMRLGGLRLPMAAATPDMAEAKRSIRKVTDMGIDILCLGHGAPLIGNASTAVRRFAESRGI